MENFFLVGNHRVHRSLGIYAAATTASRVRLPSGRLATSSRNGLRQGVLRLALGGIGQGNLLVQQPLNSNDTCVYILLQCFISQLPGDGRTQVAFITYDRTVHFYQMPEGATQPTQLTVCDIDGKTVSLLKSVS